MIDACKIVRNEMTEKVVSANILNSVNVVKCVKDHQFIIFSPSLIEMR